MQECKSHGPLTRRRCLRIYSAYRAAADAIVAPAMTGVRDMLRLSDARMSGTSYGACILHAAPEAAIGGPLALVKNGDMIEVDVAARKLNLLVDEAELEARRRAWQPPEETVSRGYQWMSARHIQQADKGCDFDFLEGDEKSPEPEIF